MLVVSPLHTRFCFHFFVRVVFFFNGFNVLMVQVCALTAFVPACCVACLDQCVVTHFMVLF